MKKRILLPVVLLCFAALFVLSLPIEAQAVEVISGTCGATGNNLTWTLDDTGTLIISGTGEMKNYFDDSSVPWYDHRNDIKEVVIESGVTSIGYNAFFECRCLINVVIPDSVIAIDSYAFAYCTGLTSVTMGSGVEIIESHSFYYCSGLTGEMIIPEKLTKIDGSSFAYCKGLTSVVIGNNVKSIGNYAFDHCSGLISVKIPSSVTDIGYGAFISCSSLTSVAVGNGVKSIGNYAFNNTSLKKISFKGSAPTITTHTFNGCTMTAYYNPDETWTADVMQNYGGKITWVSYDQCDHSATEWEMLDSLSHERVCTDCQSMVETKEHTFTPTVTAPSMGVMGYTTYHCDVCGYSYVGDENDIVAYGTYEWNNNNVTWKLDIYGTLTISGKGAIEDEYGSELPSYPWFAYRNDLKNVVIENGITIIGKFAFYNCRNLLSVSIPQSVTIIGRSVFYDCRNLTSVNISEGVTSIGGYAFGNCGKLTSITIPSSVSNIDPDTFINCFRLTGIWVDENNQFYCNDNDGVLYSKDKTAIIRAPETLSGDYVIPEGVTSIGDYAFDGCYNLTSVDIPEGVTSIGYSAFYGCYNLTSVTIPESITKIESDAFSGCDNLQYNPYDGCVYLGNESNPYVALIDCVDSTSASCTIHSNTKIIASGAFIRCDNLTSVDIPEGVTSIGVNAFFDCDNLFSVTIPSSITIIGNSAFDGCNNLQYNNYGNCRYLGNESNPFFALVEVDDSVVSCVIHPDTKLIADYVINWSNITEVYYCGTSEQWSAVIIGDANTNLIKADWYYHNYDEFIITVNPTFSTTGEKEKACIFCGDTVTETLDVLVGKVNHWNIVLEDDYAVNFYMQVSESIESTAKVRLTIGNDTVTYNISDLEKTEDGYFRLIANISAAQMNDFITVMVMNGRDIGSNTTYTARQYCDTILEDSQYSQYHVLVKEMLNYGAMAQMYFAYDTDYLANEGITGVANTAVPEVYDDIAVSDKIRDLSFYGASLVYRDKIAVRYYFTGDVTGCVFTAKGNTYTPVAKDGKYYIEIADILPQNLDQQITLTVTDADGNMLSVSYGPMNYIVRVYQKGDQATKDLLKALYNYHLAAKAL